MKVSFIIYCCILLLIIVSVLFFSFIYLKEGFETNDNKGQIYTALIIEPRKHPATEFVLKNFITTLSNEWKFIIFHGNNNKEFMQNIIEQNFEAEKSRIKLVDLHVDNLTLNDYNEILYSHDFYDNIDTEMFLIFQTDTMLFKENIHKLDSYLQYDFVGAALLDNDGAMYVGNGGLSLRRKSKMLEVLNHCQNGRGINEDGFFSNFKNHCPKIEINKPTVEKAKEFSVENVYYDNPIGVHAAWKHNPDKDFNKNSDYKTLVELNKPIS